MIVVLRFVIESKQKAEVSKDMAAGPLAKQKGLQRESAFPTGEEWKENEIPGTKDGNAVPLRAQKRAFSFVSYLCQLLLGSCSTVSPQSRSCVPGAVQHLDITQ